MKGREPASLQVIAWRPFAFSDVFISVIYRSTSLSLAAAHSFRVVQTFPSPNDDPSPPRGQTGLLGFFLLLFPPYRALVLPLLSNWVWPACLQPPSRPRPRLRLLATTVAPTDRANFERKLSDEQRRGCFSCVCTRRSSGKVTP